MKQGWFRGVRGSLLPVFGCCLTLACSGRSTTKLSTHSPDEGREQQVRGGDASVQRADAAVEATKSDAGLAGGSSNGSLDGGLGNERPPSSSSAAVDAGGQGDAGVTPTPPLVIDGRQVLASGNELRFESVSASGRWIAFTEYETARPSDSECDPRLWECYTSVALKLVATSGGDPLTLAEGLDLAFARFVGETLFIMRGNKRVPEALNGLLETAPELLAWRPGDSQLTSLGVDADPGAFRSTKDERWVSVEINDVLSDMTPVAELALIETATLSVRSVATKDRMRGRFSRDSKWLFYGGAEDKLDGSWTVNRLSLVDAAVQTVEEVSDEWWKVSHDGQWLIHRHEDRLLRTPAEGGAAQRITDVFVGRGGKQFDVGKDGKTLSFRPLNFGSPGLYSVPLLGGEVAALYPNPFDTLLAHFDSTVVYSRPSETDGWVLCAVSTLGGESQELGAYEFGDIESYVLDDKGDELIVRDAKGVVRLLRTTAEAPTQLLDSGRGARFLSGGRVLSLRDSVAPMEHPPELRGGGDGRVFSLQGEGTLILHDAEGATEVEAQVTGPFEIDPNRRAWYVTTVRGANTTNLVVDVVP